MTVRAFAPGRANLIGEHTDYTGGLVLPFAVQLGTTVVGAVGGDRVELTSAELPGQVSVDLNVEDPARVEPKWGRYVAGVVAELRPAEGLVGSVATTLPIGGGLSSSSALSVAVALALGFSGEPHDLARLGQRAEQRASGVRGGIMDQLTAAVGTLGSALLIDCHTLDIEPIPVPTHLEVVVVPSGQDRVLAESAYGTRRDEAERAQATIGPLREAAAADAEAIADAPLRRRARHIVSENARVRDCATALRAGDGPGVGALLNASHASLRDDFEVSTPALDDLADRLQATPGVHGARLMGGGFGGCVVALAEPGAVSEGWVVRPSRGAMLL